MRKYFKIIASLALITIFLMSIVSCKPSQVTFTFPVSPEDTQTTSGPPSGGPNQPPGGPGAPPQGGPPGSPSPGGPPPGGMPGKVSLKESDLSPQPVTPAGTRIINVTDIVIKESFKETDNVALDFSRVTTGKYNPQKNSYVYLQNINSTEYVDAPKGVFIFYKPGTHCFLLDSTGSSANGTFILKSGGVLTPLKSAETANNHYEATMAVQGGILFGKADRLYKIADQSKATYVYQEKESYNNVEYTRPFYYRDYSKWTLSGLNWKIDSSAVNTSIAFARFGAEICLKNSNFESYSRSNGPFEGGNFFGLNSAFLADSYGKLVLDNIKYTGSANAVFAVYDGHITINRGSISASSSGAHGLYVANRGVIDVNPEKKGSNKRDFLTKVTTVDEASTTLATDTGGGTINAYNVECVSYGLRSAGVYSIGAGEGNVNVYNSQLTSYLDAGIVSASGGSIHVENSVLQGVFGIKTREHSGEGAEVVVKNSKVVSRVDIEALKKAGYVTSPDEFDENDPQLFNTSSPKLNIFVDKARGDLNKESYYYWFGNKDGTNKYVQAPGHSGGGTIAVIFTDNSETPVKIISSLLKNENYEYSQAHGGDARNYLISSENGGTAVVIFRDCNRMTRWDVTGEVEETTEIKGDFYVAYQQTYTNMFGTFTGDSYLNVTLNNSDWIGTVVGNGQGTNLTMDATSSWKVTADTILGTLDVSDYSRITADKPVTIHAKLVRPLSGGERLGDNSYKIGNITYIYSY